MVGPTAQGERLNVVRMNDSVVTEIALETNNVIRFRVQGIYKSRTGTHGTLQLYIDTMLMSYSGGINIDRDEDRVRLVNSAYKQLPEPLQSFYSIENMKRDLTVFCSRAWDVWVDAETPLEIVGNPYREPITFLLKPFLTKGGGTILFGPPGRGKSYIGMLMAASMQHGLQSLWATEQSKVLFVNLERSAESVQQRIGAVNSALGLEPTLPMLVLNARGRRLVDVSGIIERAVSKHEVEIVILDSLSRAGMGDLTDNTAVNATMDIMNSVSPSWLGLGHSPRQDASHIYGGIHFDAASDVMVQQISEHQPNKLGIALKITKANDIGRYPANLIGLEFDESGLARVWRPASSEFPQLVIEASSGQSLAGMVVDYLKRHGSGTPAEIVKEVDASQHDVINILSNNELFYFLRKQDNSIRYSLREGASAINS